MRLRTLVPPLIALITLAIAREASAQPLGVERLPPEVFAVVPPSARVRGEPGAMTVQPRACRTLPTGDTRRRIVDVAVQEWGFFGFRVADPADVEDDAPGNGTANADGPSPDGRRGRRGRLPPAEAARVAASIAGYWAVTPEGPWIVQRQNDRWEGPDGIAARWNAPWSAAFVSWVMCEAGLGATHQFQRAIAHHTYIDQAIRARAGRAPQAAFVAYDAGETTIAPGDLLCSSRRPAYRTIAERRQQMGVGARSHCDVVVKVDEARARIHAIGGNVRGVVSLKQLPAIDEAGRPLRLRTGDGERPMFAHLKLRAAPIDANALDTSPTIAARSRRDVISTARPPGRPGAQPGS
ncbi:MAG: DUF2272 domain-containing protein [Vicinamibacterales bacterium]